SVPSEGDRRPVHAAEVEAAGLQLVVLPGRPDPVPDRFLQVLPALVRVGLAVVVRVQDAAAFFPAFHPARLFPGAVHLALDGLPDALPGGSAELLAALQPVIDAVPLDLDPVAHQSVSSRYT